MYSSLQGVCWVRSHGSNASETSNEEAVILHSFFPFEKHRTLADFQNVNINVLIAAKYLPDTDGREASDSRSDEAAILQSFFHIQKHRILADFSK